MQKLHEWFFRFLFPDYADLLRHQVGDIIRLEEEKRWYQNTTIEVGSNDITCGGWDNNLSGRCSSCGCFTPDISKHVCPNKKEA